MSAHYSSPSHHQSGGSSAPGTPMSPQHLDDSTVDFSLVGKWKLMRDGSDYLPGLDSLPDAPVVLRLIGSNDIEFFKIEKKKIVDAEEIVFTYTSKNFSISKAYQVGILNIENINGNEVTLAIVQNCDQEFHEFTVMRMCPKQGQYR